jgi:hypothetical protein
VADSKRYTGAEVQELRNHYWENLQNTRSKATEARQLLAGELGIELPETVTVAGADAWIGDLPHKKTGPQRVRQKLIGKQWELKRPRASGGQRAASVSTRIEQPLEAIMKDEDAGFPWEDANDICLLEGLVFSTVSLVTHDWRSHDTFFAPDKRSHDDNGLVITASLDARYAMDKDGRFRGEDGYDEASVDVNAMRREYEADRHDRMARNLPFRQRAYSIRSCQPIFGADLKLEGLIIETHWSQREAKRRGMHVSSRKTDKSGSHLYPLGAIGEGDTSTGTGGLLKVTEAWLLDEDGLPYITYCVDGGKENGLPAFRQNKNTGNYEPYIIDLGRMHKDKRGQWQGFSRLPISWGWGLGWSAADLDKRSMPFTEPFQQSWRNVDALMTTIVASAMWLAFPALIEKVSIADMADESLDEKERKLPDIQMLKITRVTGDIQNVGSQGPHPSVFEAIGLALGENKNEQPGGQGDSGSSGFAMTLSEALESDALTTVHATVMKMVSQNASYILEGAKILGECYEPVQVYKLPDVLLESNEPSDTGKPMVLEPGLIGRSYDVKALTKKVPGENPAVRQQNAALVKEGFYDRVWFLEQDGYPSPEEMNSRVAYQEILDSDVGKAATVRMLQQYVNDRFVEQIQEAQATQEADATGLPQGLADGVSPPPEMAGMLAAGPQAGGEMAGLGVGNPAASALAGQVSGGMQTGPLNRAAEAGGEIPMGAV